MPSFPEKVGRGLSKSRRKERFPRLVRAEALRGNILLVHPRGLSMSAFLFPNLVGKQQKQPRFRSILA